MTALIVLIGIAAVLLATVFCRVNEYGSPYGKLLSKTLASLAFVALGGVCAVKAGTSAYAILVVLGLILGCLGDVLLQMMDCRPDKRDTFFRLGLGAFLIGHVLYIPAFLSLARFTVWPLVIAAVLFMALFVLQFPAKISLGVQKVPVYVYAAVIALMVGSAVSAAVFAPSLRTGLVLAGGMLFAVSDSVLSLIFFSPCKWKGLGVLNLSTYYLAQILLAFSIAAL